jgi:hypothetical protein
MAVASALPLAEATAKANPPNPQRCSLILSLITPRRDFLIRSLLSRCGEVVVVRV